MATGGSDTERGGGGERATGGSVIGRGGGGESATGGSVIGRGGGGERATGGSTLGSDIGKPWALWTDSVFVCLASRVAPSRSLSGIHVVHPQEKDKGHTSSRLEKSVVTRQRIWSVRWGAQAL